MKDPIGLAIYDFHFKKHAEPIVVNSNYTEDEVLDPAWFFRSYEEMPPLEKKALELCRGKILDIGAGAGCHALYLQENGFEVVALEKSALAVEVLKAQRVRQILQKDILELEEGSFDTLLLLMNGIGMAGTLEKLTSFLEHLKNLLSPEGQILVNSADISYLFGEDDGSVWIDLSNEKYFGEMIYELKYRKARSDKFFWLFVDYDTLSETAASAGFSCEMIMEGSHNDYLARLK